jgi:hypothetical protein
LSWTTGGGFQLMFLGIGQAEISKNVAGILAMGGQLFLLLIIGLRL